MNSPEPAYSSVNGGKLHDTCKAAWLLEDAMEGVFAEKMHATDRQYHREAYIRYENMQYPERVICVFVLLLVSFTELPLWCLSGRSGLWMWQNAHEVCVAPGHVYLSGTDYLPVGWTLVAEVAAVAYLGYLLLLEMNFSSKQEMRLKLRSVLTCAYGVDLLAFAVAVSLGWSPWFRLAPYCRIGLLCVSVGPIYDSLQAAVCLLPTFFNVAIMLCITVLFFGWLSAVVLDDLRFENHAGVMANDGFSSFSESMYTMWFVSTTSDFPDQMLPSFTSYRLFGVFFFFYVILAVFVFQNLVLAVVYDTYKDHAVDRVKTQLTNRARGIAAAFRLLAETNPTTGEMEISKQCFKQLVTETNKVERVPDVTPATVDFFFSIMDDDGSGSVSGSEFYDVCDILQYSFQRISTRTFVEQYVPGCARSTVYQTVKTIVASRGFKAVVTSALVVNSLLVLLQSYFDLANTTTTTGDSVWGAVELCFSLFYTLMLCCELLVTPFGEFWLQPKNRFDFCVTILLFATAVYWALPCTDVGPDLLHYLTILRVLRLLNLLATIERFKLIINCIYRIVPASVGVVGLLFASGACFSVFGVQFFGGAIYDGQPAIADGDYLDAHYDVLNFNDFSMGFIPLFTMITTGGPVNEFIEAMSAVSAFPGAGVVFFLAWYVVGNLIMVNIFSAFVIDAFQSQYQDAHANKCDTEGRSLDQSTAGDGFRIVAKRSNNADDVYKAMFADGLESENLDQDREGEA